MNTKYFERITPNDLNDWANLDVASVEFPRIIRMLCKRSAPLEQCEFYSNETTNRHGFDGITVCHKRNNYVPLGTTFWEIGTGRAVKHKAQTDYLKGIKAKNKSDRTKATFIFVTPRKWNEKEAWRKGQNKKKEWKNVKIYDAEDICQWAEMNIFANVLLREELGKSFECVMTLRKSWQEWTSACMPPLNETIFRSDIVRYKEEILTWLGNKGQRYLTIRADTELEGLAFLYLLSQEKDFDDYIDKFLVIKNHEQALDICEAFACVPIAASFDIAKKMCSTRNGFHSIRIITAGDFLDEREDELVIKLSVLSNWRAERILSEYPNKSRDILKEYGGSRSELRRLLSDNPCVRSPWWGGLDHENARLLIPLLFNGGRYSFNNSYHQAVLQDLLEDKDIGKYNRELFDLATGKDVLLTSDITDDYICFKQVEKALILFTKKKIVEKKDIKRFEGVLSKALLWGEKNMDEYTSFKGNIYKIAVFLVVKRREYFQYLDEEINVMSNNIQSQLFKLPIDTFFAKNGKCCHYIAEAWPSRFLSYINNIIIEGNEEKTRECLNGLPMTVQYSLKQGLELLAVHPEYFEKSVIVLSRIYQIIGLECYFHSLQCLFLACHAMTNATSEERLFLLKAHKIEDSIVSRISQKEVFDNTAIALSNYSARYRRGEWELTEVNIPFEEIERYREGINDICIDTIKKSEPELIELLRHIFVFSTEQRKRIWRILQESCRGMNNASRLRFWKIVQDRIGEIRRLENKNRNSLKFIREARQFAKSVIPEDIYTFIGILFSYSVERRFSIGYVGEEREARLTRWRTFFINRLPRRDGYSLSKILGEGEDINYRALASSISKSFQNEGVVNCIREIIVKKEETLVILARHILDTYKGVGYISLLSSLRKLLSKGNFLELMLMDGWREEKIEMLKSMLPEDEENFWRKITANTILKFSSSDEFFLSHLYKVGRFNDIIEFVGGHMQYFGISEKGEKIVLDSAFALSDCMEKEKTPSAVANGRIIPVLNYFAEHNTTEELYKIEYKLLSHLNMGNYRFPGIKKRLLQTPVELIEWLSMDPSSTQEFQIYHKMLRIILAPPNILELVSDGRELLKLITSIITSGIINSSHKRGAFVRLIAGFWARTERKEILLGIGEIMEQLIKSGNFKKNFLDGVLSDAYGTSNRGLFSTEACERRAIKRLNNMAIELKPNCPLTSRLLSEASISLKKHIQWLDDMERLEEREREY